MNAQAILNFPQLDLANLPSSIYLMSHGVLETEPGFGGMYLALAIEEGGIGVNASPPQDGNVNVGGIGIVTGVPPQIFQNIAPKDAYFNLPVSGSNPDGSVRDPMWIVGPDGYIWLSVCDGTMQTGTLHIYKSWSLSDAPQHVVDLVATGALGTSHWVYDGTNYYVVASQQSGSGNAGYIWQMPSGDKTVAGNWTKTTISSYTDEPFAGSNWGIFYAGGLYWAWSGDQNGSNQRSLYYASAITGPWTLYGTQPSIPSTWVYPNLAFSLPSLAQPVPMPNRTLRFYSSIGNHFGSMPAYADIYGWIATTQLFTSCYSFDGGTYASVSNSALNNWTNQTIAFWHKYVGDGTVIQKGQTADANAEWSVQIATAIEVGTGNQNCSCAVYYKTTQEACGSLPNGYGSLIDGTWHFVVAQISDAGGIVSTNLWIDNVLCGTATDTTAHTGTISAKTAAIFVGGGPDDGFLFTGFLNGVAVWNRLLSATEMTALWNSGAGTETYPASGLEVYYKLQQTTGTTFTDSGPNSLTSGTIANGGSSVWDSSDGAPLFVASPQVSSVIACPPQGFTGTAGAQPEFACVARITDPTVIARVLSQSNLTTLAVAKLAASGGGGGNNPYLLIP